MANPTVTPIMTPARGPGVPDAQPVYLVDVYGNPIGSTNGYPVAPTDGLKATYRYAIQATAPYASATDWIVLRGSASKTVRITHIELSGAATAATEVIMLLKKHTVANTGGTFTNPTPTLHDSTNGVSIATVLLYSVAPTIDGTATIFQLVRLTLAVAPAATANLVDRFILDYGNRPAQALVLRGAAQELALQPGTIPSGGVYDVVIEWTEE